MSNNQSRLVPNECPICLLEIRFNEERRTACGHIFHAVCLERWLNRNPSCPLCRAHLPGPDDDETDASEDEGMVEQEFDVFLYAVAEMLPLFVFFQAICISRFPNANQTAMQRIVPGLFQMMMDVVPQVEFELLIDEREGWFERQEVINSFLEGNFDNEPLSRGYLYEADHDPSIHRMVAIYESFIDYTGFPGHTSDSYVLFEEFLSRLNEEEQYLLFRSRQYQTVFQRLGLRRN